MSDRAEQFPGGVCLTDGDVAAVEELVVEKATATGELVERLAAPDERERLGRELDARTADVFFIYAETLNPYGDVDVSPEWSCVGREYFAVDPEIGVAVHWHDLPDQTRDSLESKRRLADVEAWHAISKRAVAAQPPP